MNAISSITISYMFFSVTLLIGKYSGIGNGMVHSWGTGWRMRSERRNLGIMGGGGRWKLLLAPGLGLTELNSICQKNLTQKWRFWGVGAHLCLSRKLCALKNTSQNSRPHIHCKGHALAASAVVPWVLALSSDLPRAESDVLEADVGPDGAGNQKRVVAGVSLLSFCSSTKQRRY